ncbi:MAG TPA: dTDP-glucose 4,6-dehydratase [Planctomycetaceae bacterium]|nr:dTDP-glucose 4,6-dehydratase [Planctomycetaceae bacterium]
MAGTILVTGGAGFIGGCFVRQWVRTEHDTVVNFDKLTYAGNLDSIRDALADPRHQLIRADICDEAEMARGLASHRPQAIIHFAAESHVDRSIDGPEAFVQTNIVGTFRLLQASLAYWRTMPTEQRDRFRFLYVSTDEIHGSAAAGEFFDEVTAVAPNSPYSASKAAGGHLVQSYWTTYGLPVIETVCSNNYGPFQFPEKLIPLMILNAVERKPLPMYGDGSQERDWLHVEDHCEALRCVLKEGDPGCRYSIGGDGPRSNRSVIEQICQMVDDRCPDLDHYPSARLIKSVTDRPGHDHRYAIDSRRIRNELGWKPRYDFESGLRETVDWYLTNTDWVDRVTTGVYRRERLGLESEEFSSGQGGDE